MRGNWRWLPRPLLVPVLPLPLVGHARAAVVMRFFFCSFLFYSFLTAPMGITPAAAGQSLPLIKWAKNSAPPFYIREEGDAGAGFADGVQAFIEQALPQFDHRTVYMPLARLNDFWQKRANYCFASMIYTPTPQSTDYVLSRPNVYYLPHGVITHPQFAPADGDSVSLQNLLSQPDWTLGLIANRTFGETIDNLMKQHQDTIHSFVRSDREGLQSLLRMLALGRIDYLIDYQFVYEYYRKQAPFRQQLQFLRIEETSGRGILGAVGCTDNAWGNAIMSDVNQAIRRLLQSPQYRRFITDWQAVTMDHQQYWRTFHTRVAASQSDATRANP